jgi:hypothetical protein
MEPWDAAAPLSEQEAYAEHRAALDATLFPSGAPIVLELRDGALELRG